MKKSKVVFHLVSWSVAVVAALVILMAVLFVEFVPSRLTASADVSSIVAGVTYSFDSTIDWGAPCECSTDSSLTLTVTAPNNISATYYSIWVSSVDEQICFGAGDFALWLYYSSGVFTSYEIYSRGSIIYTGYDPSTLSIEFSTSSFTWTDYVEGQAAESALMSILVGSTPTPGPTPDPIVVSSNYYNVTPTAFEAITSAGNFNCAGTIYYGGIWQETFTSISVSEGSTLQDLDVIFNDASLNTVGGWAEGDWIVRPRSYNEGTFYPSDGDVRVVFSSAGNISGKYLYNLYQIINLPIVPVFGDIIDVYQELPTPNVQGGLNYLPSINNLKAVELTNASSFVTSRTDSSGTYYYVPVYFNDIMYNTWHGVSWAYTDDDSRWWLLFSVPTNISYNVRLSYYSDMSYYTELSYFYDPNSDMSPVLGAFVSNYRNTTYGLDNEFQIAYQEGADAGYSDGYSDNNTLISVFWAAFEFPFRILFGTYNSTTGFYDGGLFNFTILGLDIRAFVLSIISVCLIVAIIKLILGSRGGGSNG